MFFNAINKSNRTPEDFAALLSPAALPYLEQMAEAARMRKKDILVILYAFLHLYILLITARITVYTVVLTATTRLREPNLMHRK